MLGNAVKYTDQRRVSLRVSPENWFILFAVSDTGPGIDLADQGRIFHVFAIAAPAPDIDLSVLPEALVAELRRAAEMLDMDAVRSIATRLAREHEDIATHLETLVNDFRFDLITVLCEKR